MKMEKLTYLAPAIYVVDMRPECNYLQSGEDGNIDPGTDDPWGDY